MQITVELKQVYGKDMYYPACFNSRIFANMLGAKTLTRQALCDIKKLGYTIAIAGQTEF